MRQAYTTHHAHDPIARVLQRRRIHLLVQAQQHRRHHDEACGGATFEFVSFSKTAFERCIQEPPFSNTVLRCVPTCGVAQAPSDAEGEGLKARPHAQGGQRRQVVRPREHVDAAKGQAGVV